MKVVKWWFQKDKDSAIEPYEVPPDAVGYPVGKPEPDPLVAYHEENLKRIRAGLPSLPKPEPFVAPVPAVVRQRTPTEHELDVKAVHEKVLRARALPDGPERAAAWAAIQAEQQRIRMWKHLNHTQEDLQAQFWDFQFQIETLKAEWEALPPGSPERFAKAHEIDEASKHRSHIIYALKRADGSFNVTEPVGHTGPRPVR